MSVDILQQTCYQQANITMQSHGFPQLVNDKSVASCQVDGQNLLSSKISTLYQQLSLYPRHTRCAYTLRVTLQFKPNCTNLTSFIRRKFRSRRSLDQFSESNYSLQSLIDTFLKRLS